MEQDRKQLVTLIIPAFNEEANIEPLYERVSNVVSKLDNYQFEFIVIDNCSSDSTEEMATNLPKRDSRWRYIRFSRNFGFETSLAAGVEYASGDALIFLPSDLQDPPEYIGDMLKEWQNGYDVVYGVLEERQDGSLLKTLGAKFAYQLINRLSDIRIPPDATDFRLLSRPVIEALRHCRERARYLRGLAHWVGFRQKGIPYKRQSRKQGSSSAHLLFCIGFALNAIFVFSTQPLRIASLLGALAMTLSLAGGFTYTALLYLSRQGAVQLTPPPPGWTTLVLLVLFFGGVQSLFIGIIGEYLSKVYIEVKQRPLWLIDKTVGFSKERDPKNQ